MVLVKILLVGGRSIADSDLAFYHAVIPYATRIALPPEDVDTWMNDEVLRTVVAKTASYWSKIGVEAPHWSVLTTDKFVPSQLAANHSEFYNSGALDSGLIRDLLNRAGRSRGEFLCALEFGCGVGRATAHLAQAFEKVIAVDISSAHLEASLI
jgi:hypothetical protein